MKKLKIVEGFLTVSEAEFKRFEAEFDLKLPPFFKQFLEQYNGSRIYENWAGKQYLIQNILPLYSPVNTSIQMILPFIRRRKSHRDDNAIGRKNLIPFAIDISNLFYCVSIAKKDYKSVYLTEWNPETGSCLSKLSDNFELFMNQLQRDEEGDKEWSYLTGKSMLLSILSYCFMNKSYDQAIQQLRLEFLKEPYYAEGWVEVKRSIVDRGFLGDLLEVFHKTNLSLREDSEAEAYKWLDLLIHNVEAADESELRAY